MTIAFSTVEVHGDLGKSPFGGVLGAEFSLEFVLLLLLSPSSLPELRRNQWYLKNMVECEGGMVPQRKFRVLVPEEGEMDSWQTIQQMFTLARNSLFLSCVSYLQSPVSVLCKDF